MTIQHVQLRYNTTSVDGILPWRVIIDGEECLAQDVEIRGVAYGETSYVDGVAKFNLAVDGAVTWANNKAVIVSA